MDNHKEGTVNPFKTNKQEKLSLRQSLQKAHERYGHIAPKRLVDFKKKGKLYSSLIPSKGRLDFKAKDCPICLAMKYKKPPKPEAVEVENKQELGLWEKVSVDSSGKFRIPSFRGNRYYSLFICAKSGRKLYFAHRRKSHFPLVFLNLWRMLDAFRRCLSVTRQAKF